MDGSHFDRITRVVGAESTRRSALRGLAAGILGAAGLGSIVQEIAARRNGRNNNKRRRCGRQYYGCNDDNECCHGMICQELKNHYA